MHHYGTLAVGKWDPLDLHPVHTRVHTSSDQSLQFARQTFGVVDSHKLIIYGKARSRFPCPDDYVTSI